MKRTIEKVSDTRVKAIVEVDKDAWKGAQDKAFAKVSAKVSIPGFRPGKAPKALLAQKVNPETVWNEAIESLLNPIYSEILSEEKIVPGYRPGVNVTKLSDDVLELVFEIVLAPTCELGKHTGLKARQSAPSVTPEEIDEAVKKRLEGSAELVLSEGPAALGDTVTIDFEGFLPDEEGKLTPFDGGKAENYALELGSHQFIPGFEEAIVGLKSEEKKKIDVTFPENYVKELAGKAAVFNVTVHEIKRKVIPNLDDEAVKGLSIDGVSTVEELKAHERDSLLAKKLSDSENAFYDALVAEIVEGSVFHIDGVIIHEEAHRSIDSVTKQIEQNGLTLEQYLEIVGQTPESFHALQEAEAEKAIKRALALDAIAVAEKLAVTDEDVDKEIKRMAAEYKIEEPRVRQILGEDLSGLKSNLERRAVREWILTHGASKEGKPAEAKPAEPKAKAPSKGTPKAKGDAKPAAPKKKPAPKKKADPKAE